MERFRPIMAGMCAIAVVALLTTPTFAGKTALEDEEMDQVTAAGQPKITQARTTEGTAEAVNFQVNVFAAHIGGQEELTALTLNNIFGENQVANAVNIQSGSDNEGTQANNIVQSWGSAKAHASVLAPGAPVGRRCVARRASSRSVQRMVETPRTPKSVFCGSLRMKSQGRQMRMALPLPQTSW